MNHETYSEQLNAMLDGELPASDVAPLARHITACPDCARELAELAALRAALHREYEADDASSAFYTKIIGLLDSEARQQDAPNIIRLQPRPVRRRLAWLAAGTAIAAMLAISILPHRNVTADLMSVRDAALRGGISSSVALGAPGPVIPGFHLTASRADIIAGHAAQVSAYSRNHQTIILCMWPANGEAAHGVRHAVYKGMVISYWNDGKQEYWAATTGPSDVLEQFVASARRI